MAVRTFIVDLQGGDLVTSDTDLIFKIYGSADSYTTAIVTTGSHTTDANVTVSGASVTIVYEVGSETLFKVSALDEAGNESTLSTATGITDTTIPATPIITAVVDLSTLKPKLLNFSVENATPTRVNFESTQSIAGMTTTGFTISGKTISSVTINGTSTTGHYFTVSAAFTFWDNNTIRLESGDGTVYDFTLTYIENNITEPSASTNRYASVTGGGLHDGTSEANAWTFLEALNNAASGQTVWVKAGNYGTQTVNQDFGVIGTASSPVKFVGYKTTIGDITTNYWDGTIANFDNSEMPTITGSVPTSGDGLQVYWNSEYLIFRNIQITNLHRGVYIRSDATVDNIIFDNVNGYLFGNSTDNGGSFLTVDSSITNGGNLRVINSFITDFSQNAMVLYGAGNCLVDNVTCYNERVDAKPDYQINFNGDNNIIRNCYVEIKGDYYTASTHGIGLRGDTKGSSTYNLIEKCTALNLNEGFYVRNYGSNNNIIKDNYSGNNGVVTNNYRGGIYIWGGCNNNVFERNYIDDVVDCIGIKQTTGEDGVDATEIGTGNIIRNNIFSNSTRLLSTSSNLASSTFTNNSIVNNTFYNIGVFKYDNTVNVTISGLTMENNIFDSVASIGDGITGVVFDYNDFYNSWSTGIGANDINENPTFDAVLDDSGFTPTNAALVAGTSLSGVEYDYDNTERDSTTPTIGAKEI